MIRPVSISIAAAALGACFPLVGSCAGDRPIVLNVGETGRYFVDEHGHAVFWQGDTEWELFHLFTAADAGTLLERRHQQGFNVIQVMATGVYPEWDAMKGVKPAGHSVAWRDNDPLNPDEVYFQRVDQIVDRAASYGMVLVIGV